MQSSKPHERIKLLNLTDVEQLEQLLDSQIEYLASSDMASLQQLEDRKTSLLKDMFASTSGQINEDLKRGLERCATKQQSLEALCMQIRDELGNAVSKQLLREKALQAYTDSSGSV